MQTKPARSDQELPERSASSPSGVFASLRGSASSLPSVIEVARNLVPADGFAIWRLDAASRSWVVVDSYGVSDEFASLRSSGEFVMPEEPIYADDIREHPAFEHRAAALEREGIRSVLAVPLHLTDGRTATIGFYFRTPHTITQEEISRAKALADLTSSAITSAQLYSEQSRARERSDFLADASSVLASSLHFEETLHAVAQMAVPRIADWCAIDLVESDSSLRRIAVTHADPAKARLGHEIHEKFPPVMDPNEGFGRVLATGQPVLYAEIPDELILKSAQSEEHLRILRELGLRSAMIVPLVSRKHIIGIITLVAAESGRIFDVSDLTLANTLANRAAVAVENAQLFQAMRESEEKFRAVSETAPCAIYIHDGHKLLYVNRASQLVSGYSREELSAQDMWAFVHPDDAAMVRARAAARFHGEDVPARYEYRIIRKDGTIAWLDFTAAMIEFGGHRVLLATAFDVTDRKLAEDALRRSEKLATAGRLAATIAHEINNPLEAITNLLYLIKHEPAGSEQLQNFIDMADHELRRVSHITRQTLGFYRESVGPIRFELRALVDDVFTLLSRRGSAKQLELQRDMETPANIIAPQGEVRQIVANLLTNSIDATDEGRIIVRVRETRDPKALDQRVVLTVADTGQGIALKHRHRLFEPFFTTKRDIGTGLGLWVTRQLVEKNGGTIRVRSREGQGTVFRVTLPQVPRTVG